MSLAAEAARSQLDSLHACLHRVSTTRVARRGSNSGPESPTSCKESPSSRPHSLSVRPARVGADYLRSAATTAIKDVDSAAALEQSGRSQWPEAAQWSLQFSAWAAQLVAEFGPRVGPHESGTSQKEAARRVQLGQSRLWISGAGGKAEEGRPNGRLLASSRERRPAGRPLWRSAGDLLD